MIDRVLESEVMDDPAASAAYDAMDHTLPNRAFVERLIELGIDRCSSALDLGTGPGDIPVHLCGQVAQLRVMAVDLAATMLELAETKVWEADLADRIELVHMDVKSLDFADDSFDAVFSNTILHHLAEPGKMLAEAARVLRPGGLLLIRDLFRPDTEAQLDALVAKHAVDCDPEQRQLFADSLRAALTPDELRNLANQQGLNAAHLTIDTDRHASLQHPASL